MKYRTPRLPPILLKELDGLPWTLVPGTRHWHLRINGHLVGILPHGSSKDEESSQTPVYNLRSNIRRWVRENAVQGQRGTAH